MANNKYAGYTPTKDKTTSGWEDSSRVGNGLDRVNPYEFRKGMDYELIELGCSRLAESTIEEREKATKSVLKNLEEYDAYYSALIQYETEYRNPIEGIKKPSFKAYLKEMDDYKMKEVKNVFKFGKMKDADHKNDKMVNLKEAIKLQIKKSLFEAEEDKEEEEEEETAKKATKGAKKAEKGMARFEREEMAIDQLLFGKTKGEEEVSKDNPGKGSLLFLKDKHLEDYKKDKDVDKYKKSISLPDVIMKKLQKHADVYSNLGNNIKINDIKGKNLPDTIKKLEVRKTSIKKERQEAQAEVGKQKNEIASTDMTRENHLRLLEIIRENGISLREGTDSIRSYYEIAKTAYLEGLSKGLRL